MCKESKRNRFRMHNGCLPQVYTPHRLLDFFDLHITDCINQMFFILFCLLVCLSDFLVCTFFRVLSIIVSPRPIVLMSFKVNILLYILKTCNISQDIVISGDQMLPLRTHFGFLLPFTDKRRINNNIDTTAPQWMNGTEKKVL